jgi:hypothetical protein
MALREVYCESAAGSGDIHCDCIRALPLAGNKYLLSIYHHSISSGHVPGAWKKGLLLLKPK